ncbi:MAG: MFS transporter [Parvibaculaceae bacterium]
MISTRLSAALAARNIHYGWVVAGVTFLTMLATAGAMGSAGVLIQPLRQEFGWTTEQISAAIAVRLVLYGLFGPFAAVFMNQWGVRTVASFALLMIMSGIVGSYFMTEVWQLVLLWGVIIGIGTGMTALVLGATVATRWFGAKRGLVVGIMTAANATGSLAFLPLLAAVTESFGWRSALTTLVIVLIATIVLILLFMRDRPEDVGLAKYGETELMPAPARAQSITSLLAQPVRVLIDVSGNKTFWILFGTFFVCGFSTNGLIQMHWISICGDAGITAVGAAGFLALIGVFDLIGTISSGWLSDRYDNRWLLFWFYGLRGLSLIYLPFSNFSFYELSLFAVFYGLDWVATVPPTVKLAAEHFGTERAALVFSWVFMGHQVGAASAAYFAGVIRTNFDNYLLALITAGCLCLVAALAVLTIGRPASQKAMRLSPA